MRVLGIDPGTAIVGFGIIDYENRAYKVIDYGCIFTDKDLSLDERLLIIFNEMESLIKKYEPQELAIEELFFFKNSKTVISVGQARGVIVLSGMKNGLKTAGYTPLQVKMGITGYGKAEKKQVQEMVKRILKLDEIPKPDDAADALAIAVTHINSLSSLLSIGATTQLSTKRVTKEKMSAQEYRELILKR
ncbi:MAG: crossover junction endodeoxyribonuclease RuvC [Fusobacteriaceae bacterium]